MKNLILLTSILFLAACQQSTVSNADASAENTEKQAELSTTTKADDNVSVPVAKLANNSLKFTHTTKSERAQIGVPFEIDLKFTGLENEEFTTEFSTTPGLNMNSAKRNVIALDNSGQSKSLKVSVLPQTEGIHFLNVYRVGAENEKPSVIKVVVGNKDLKEYMQSMGEIQEQADGSTVVSMKADESN